MFSRPRLASWTCKSCLAHLSRASRRQHSTKALRKPPNKSKLPSGPARTRFAPSPTGYLHLGSLRTALFNYLLAKRTRGQFLLRIEDTDQKRTIPDAEQRLFEDLRWAGLEWDEGPEVGGPYGPYKQSERGDLYREHAQKLLDSGNGYRCFCTAHRLNQLAEHRASLGLPTDYDRTCANISREQSDDRAAKGEKYVVRLRVPEKYPEYNDLIYGKFKALKPGRRGEEAYEDPILLKSDGLPTYHLANVVDDHHMRITHVIRGTEWMPSTPKHIAMYQAFGWDPPEFAHVGLLLDEKGNKLSKRNFDTDIRSFKEKMEIFPEALTNFAALLGWSHPSRSDIMTMEDIIQNFTLKFTKGNTTVTLGKLHFLQNKHAGLRAASRGPKFDEMVQQVIRHLKEHYKPEDYEGLLGLRSLEEYVSEIIVADAGNYSMAKDFLKRNDFMFTHLEAIRTSIGSMPYSQDPHLGDIARIVTGRFRAAADLLFSGDVDFTKDSLKVIVKDIISSAEDHGIENPAKEVYHYLREHLANGKAGMAIYDVMTILGPDETFRRLGMCFWQHNKGPHFHEQVQEVIQQLQAVHRPADYRRMLDLRSRCPEWTLKDYVSQILRADATKYTTADDFIKRNNFMFRDLAPPEEIPARDSDVGIIQEIVTDNFGLASISDCCQVLDWDLTGLKEMVEHVISQAESRGVENATEAVHRYLRDRLADGQTGLGIYDIMLILEAGETYQRLLDAYRSNRAA